MNSPRSALALLASAVCALPALAQPLATITARYSVTNQPIGVVCAPGDPHRTFIVDRTGYIFVAVDGVQQGTPFLDMHTSVVVGGEGGLLGLAFPPTYGASGRFFVYYTGGDPLECRLAEYTVSANPNVANPTGVVRFSSPSGFIHNGGGMAFGPDGYLYLGVGDANGSTLYPQHLDDLRGKVLRFDVSQPGPYAIPPTNPYAGAGPERDEIYHVGVRNPWRLSFDRLTGDMYLGDVGAGSREEIDYVPASSPGTRNFGWSCMEALLCTSFGIFECTCNSPGLTLPIVNYPHANPGGGVPYGCAVTGGYVYRGSAIPRYRGRYFYADYCRGQVWSIRVVNGVATDLRDHSTELGTPGLQISSMGEDSEGELYVCPINQTTVYKITARYAAGDWNRDLEVNSNDVTGYLNDWFADFANGTHVAEVTGDDESNSNDVAEFLNLWFLSLTAE